MELIWSNINYPYMRYVEVGWRYLHLSKYAMTRNHYFDISNIHSVLRNLRLDNNNEEIYTTYFLYDSLARDATVTYGCFPIDIDVHNDCVEYDARWLLAREDCYKVLSYLTYKYKIKVDDLLLFFSGRGIHIIIPPNILGIVPSADLSHKYKIFARIIKEESKADNMCLSIYEARRLFRLPNTLNIKSGLYKVQILIDELRSCDTWKDISRLARMPRGLLLPNLYKKNTTASLLFEKETAFIPNVHEGNNHLDINTEMPPCIKNILEEGAEKGVRNLKYSCLVSYYTQLGLLSQEIYNSLTDWRYNKCTPPYNSEDAVLNTTISVNGGYSWGCTKIKEIAGFCDEESCIFSKKGRAEICI